MAELREQLSVVAERVRRRSTGRSERMTIKNKVMKVLLINGSPRKQGNTFLALSEVASALEKQGITTEIVSIGTKAVQGCIACNKCGELGRCVFRDELYDTLHGKLAGADGLVVGSPTYNGQLYPPVDALLRKIAERCIPHRRFACFGSFTWAGAAVRRMTEFAEGMKWPVVGAPVELKQGYSTAVEPACRTLVDALVEDMKR